MNLLILDNGFVSSLHVHSVMFSMHTCICVYTKKVQKRADNPLEINNIHIDEHTIYFFRVTLTTSSQLKTHTYTYVHIHGFSKVYSLKNPTLS